MKKDIAFGGIKRVPGGATGSDGDLAVAVDVCNDGASLELLEKPQELFTLASGETLLCVHKPEGETKHYVTQWVYEADLPAPSDEDGDASEEESDEAESGTVAPGSEDTFPGSEGWDEPYDIITDDDYGYNTTGGGGSSHTLPSNFSDITAFTDVTPDTGTTYADTAAAYTSVIATEDATRQNDDGGADATLGENGNPTSNGIYLCYWVLENSAYVRKQVIDITAFGRVTAIQPMGNTLVCNHAGSSSSFAEVRYFLWNPDHKETVDGVETVVPKYIGLGSKPPMVDITFGLESTFEYWPKTKGTLSEDSNSVPTKHKKYGGISIECKPYTDTVPVWWGETSTDSDNYVPPYALYGGNEDYTVGSDTTTHKDWQETYSIDGVISPDGKTDVAGIKINWTRSVLGCYNKFIAEQNKDNKFVFPFYVRYAYELYDGSLVMHSYPVLMIPNSRGPIFALDGKQGLYARQKYNNETYEKTILRFKGRTYGFSSTLMHEIAAMAENDLERLKKWKDLIRGLNIYITPPIYNYDQGGQVLGWHCMDKSAPINDGEDPWFKNYTIGRVRYDTTSNNETTSHYINGAVSLSKGFDTILDAVLGATDSKKIYFPYNSSYLYPGYCMTVPQKEDKEVMELHENAGQFYKLASIDFDKLLTRLESAGSQNAEGEIPVVIGKRVVNTIAGQDFMKDDNYSHDSLSANVLYGYNRRLNMARVERVTHTPLKPKVQWARDYFQTNSETDQNKWQINIYLKNKGKTSLVKTTANDVETRWPLYVFYPNTDATDAVLIHGATKYKVKLREHKALNGMFWLGDFMHRCNDLKEFQLATPTGYTADDVLTESNANRIVDESDKIYTTETDNPFVVPFGNINIAGGGEVRALSAATQAMSQGQFGQHPMYCFTSEGVWAMTVNDTGGWGTIQPVTRDVIADNTMPLSLDTTVVFLTERGLLQLAGAENRPLTDEVRALMSGDWHKIGDIATTLGMADLLSAVRSAGGDWHTFPDVAKLAYDYRNSRIYVSSPTEGYSWVYNLKSGLWTQSTTHADVQVPTYPDCETQMGAKVINISVDRTYKSNLKPYGLVITQPAKFGAGGTLRRVLEMVVRGEFKPYGNAVKTALWGTRDWHDHALVASSTSNRLTRRWGSPYFAHSIGLFLVKSASTETSNGTTKSWTMRVAGADLEIDGEHDNKLR